MKFAEEGTNFNVILDSY